MEYVNNLKNAFREYAIYEINPEYLESVYYFPSIESADGTHFSGDAANQESYNEKIQQMYKGREIVEMLNFE